MDWGLDGRNFTFEQPLPGRLRAEFRHAVDYAAELADLDRVKVTLQVDAATPCTFTFPATSALVSAQRLVAGDRCVRVIPPELDPQAGQRDDRVIAFVGFLVASGHAPEGFQA